MQQITHIVRIRMSAGLPELHAQSISCGQQPQQQQHLVRSHVTYIVVQLCVHMVASTWYPKVPYVSTKHCSKYTLLESSRSSCSGSCMRHRMLGCMICIIREMAVQCNAMGQVVLLCACSWAGGACFVHATRTCIVDWMHHASCMHVMHINEYSSSG